MNLRQRKFSPMIKLGSTIKKYIFLYYFFHFQNYRYHNAVLLSKNFLPSIPPDQALLNFELHKNEEIRHYRVFQFGVTPNKSYHIHIFATNQNRIIKGITDGAKGHSFVLWCKIPGVSFKMLNL